MAVGQGGKIKPVSEKEKVNGKESSKSVYVCIERGKEKSLSESRKDRES